MVVVMVMMMVVVTMPPWSDPDVNAGRGCSQEPS